MDAIAPSPEEVATKLRARITPAQASAWQGGDVAAWAQEAFQVARSTAYHQVARQLRIRLLADLIAAAL